MRNKKNPVNVNNCFQFLINIAKGVLAFSCICCRLEKKMRNHGNEK
jgi:hypothetical protein